MSTSQEVKVVQVPPEWRNTPIYKHVLVFCVPGGGMITRQSIIDGHKRYGLATSWWPRSLFEYVQVKAKADVILNVLDQKGLPHHIDSFYGFVNVARTAFWNPNGTFNESQFDDFVHNFVLKEKKQEEKHGEALVTREMFQAYFAKKWTSLPEAEKKATSDVISVWHRMQITPIDVSSGSVHDLFQIYHNQWIGNERAFTVKHLRSWYARDSSFIPNFCPPPQPCKKQLK